MSAPGAPNAIESVAGVHVGNKKIAVVVPAYPPVAVMEKIPGVSLATKL